MKRSIAPRLAVVPTPTSALALFRRPEFLYSLALFLLALLFLGAAAERVELFARPAASTFFLFFGLLTVTTGYQHPRVGHVSFDRVSQVASILVLGPVDAAIINGLVSLVYPIHRLWRGFTVERVVTASLNNAGLMTLMILGCGLLYEGLGGEVPLYQLELNSLVLLPLMILAMQLVNEVGLGLHMLLRDGHWEKHLNHFVLALESGAGGAAVLVALVFNRMELSVLVLLLALITTVMIVLTQFARMRLHLETIIADRTRVLREKTVELEQLAIRDQLTGLYNRRYVDGYLNGRIEEYTRYGRRFGIALIDLDHFKRINDHHSHEVGDEVLKKVSQIFLERCRDTDVVARYGGEEFLLCFPEAGAAEVAEICEQLRAAVAGADWSCLGPGSTVTLCAGAAEMKPGLTRSALVNVADRKLYQAKHTGRNRVMR